MRSMVSMTFWTDEKLLEAAAAELMRHGGTKRDSELLRSWTGAGTASPMMPSTSRIEILNPVTFRSRKERV